MKDFLTDSNGLRLSEARPLLRKRSRRRLQGALVWAALAILLVAGTVSATELRDAELVASGLPVLQNGTGTVRLEDGRLGRLGPPVFIPEPGALWQLGSGIGLLALLARRRNHSIHRAAADAPGRANPATAKGTLT